MNEKVIIIGGDHINTLSVIRCLGEKKIDFKVLIHNERKPKEELMISHSKYCKNLVLLKNSEKDILDFLIKNSNKTEKQLIIPCSDLAEYTIDNNYSKLSKYYYIPGFINAPGKVCKLMDKYEQKKWAEKHNILMAETLKISKNYKSKDLNDVMFPCIIKPCVSAFGKKSDIKVCHTQSDLLQTLTYYFENNYNEVLIQEFLDKEYELCVVGCILENGQKYSKVIKKIREYPKTGGSASYAKFITDEKIDKEVDKIVSSLLEEGYNGLFDLDIIRTKEQFYLNEINFRNSGNSYALLKSGIKAPYLLYLEKYDKELLNKLKIKSKNIYFMEDLSNFKSLKEKQITLWTYIKNFFKAKAHSIVSIKDLNVIMHYIKKKGK